MAGSLFPGIYGVDTLITEMNLPNFLFYDNDSTMSVGYGLYDITETNDGISFEIKRSDSSTILPVMSPSSDSHSDCYDLLGRRLRRPSIHSRTLFIDGKTGKNIYALIDDCYLADSTFLAV